MNGCVCRDRSGFWQRATLRPLTTDELAWADSVAFRRHENAVKNNRRDYLGNTSIDSHRIGTRGELAFCLFFDIEWDASVGRYTSKPDVLPDFEIRVGARLQQLKIRPNEVTDQALRVRRFVLLTPCAPDFHDDYLPNGGSFHLCGWLRPPEAAKVVPLSDPGKRGRPGYFVPPEALHRLPFDGHKISG